MIVLRTLVAIFVYLPDCRQCHLRYLVVTMCRTGLEAQDLAKFVANVELGADCSNPFETDSAYFNELSIHVHVCCNQ